MATVLINSIADVSDVETPTFDSISDVTCRLCPTFNVISAVVAMLCVLLLGAAALLPWSNEDIPLARNTSHHSVVKVSPLPPSPPPSPLPPPLLQAPYPLSQ